MALFGGEESALTIVVRLKDEAQKGLDSLQKKVKDMTPAFKTMSVVGTAAFAAISTEIYSAISASNEAAKVQKQLEAVLKSTGKAAGFSAEEINKQAKALQSMTTYDDEAITAGANLLLTFKNIKGTIFQEALPAILDMSTAMGQDLKSSAIQVGKALNDPIAGLSALSRVGVTFSKEQEELITTLVETGKVAEAQKIILQELASEFGGSASAQAQTFEGHMTQLKNRLGDLQEEIGNALIPMIEKLVEKVAPVIERVVAWIEANPKLTATILAVSAGLAGLVAIIGLIGLAMPAIITTLGILGTAFTFFAATPLGLAIVGFTALYVLLEKIIKAYYDLKAISLSAGESAAQAAVVNNNIQNRIADKTRNGQDTSRLDAALQVGQESQKTLQNVADAGFFKKIGVGLGFSSYETGGTVQGPQGMAVPIMAHGQEKIIPAGQSSDSDGRAINIHFNFNGSVAGDEGIQQIIRKSLQELNRSTTLRGFAGV